ncbi:MAG: bis(5'-nucleosyl)-tetraphosphatase (symmetrical) YqeK [Dehalococcoidia bacterium]|jgi:predicted HD superfamily hydrolase involved in NAD metabolism
MPKADASDVEETLRREVERLPEPLRSHVKRVQDEGERLARRHRVDEATVRLAVLGHDLLRVTPREELLRLAHEAGIEPNEAERAEPLMLHGAMAARLLSERFAIDDAAVLDAVRYHTTGRAGMSDAEKIVFLADKTEPDELARYPEWREVRDLAQDDLDAAMARALDLLLEQARREGWTVHPDVLAAWERFRDS